MAHHHKRSHGRPGGGGQGGGGRDGNVGSRRHQPPRQHFEGLPKDVENDLPPTPADENDENGQPNYLEAKDVLGMDLKGTALIALSACESGLGRVEDGDEVLGFTRSFLSAGTSTLLASLWPVSDAATETLMTTLYDDLAKGESVQDAMRDAQRAVLANPETAHPFFWASFIQSGDWRKAF